MGFEGIMSRLGQALETKTGSMLKMYLQYVIISAADSLYHCQHPNIREGVL